MGEKLRKAFELAKQEWGLPAQMRLATKSECKIHTYKNQHVRIQVRKSHMEQKNFVHPE